MRKTFPRIMGFLFVLVIAIILISTSSPLCAEPSTFYVVTNKADGNTVVGYSVGGAGTYEKIGEFSTGGTGTGDLEVPALKKDKNHPLANGDDPLISAHSIAATDDSKFVLVVNPGDATVALLKVNQDKSLKRVNTVPAGDNFPISIGVHGYAVVVASVGMDNNHGSISAFRIKDGRLTPVKGSRRDLHARPSTIAFNTSGKFVIVNELVSGKIHVFSHDGTTLSETPVSTIDSPRSPDFRFQAIPVGFAVKASGNKDIILMSEARFLTPDFKLREGRGEVVQSPLFSWQTGSLSTYALDNDGKLALVTADALTGGGIEGGEIANCWVALSKDGSTLWTANALSSSISAFAISSEGTATLKKLTAFKVDSEQLFFGDMAVSKAGDELFQLVGNKGRIIVFDIENDLMLTPKQILSGLPQLGAYGLIVL